MIDIDDIDINIWIISYLNSQRAKKPLQPHMVPKSSAQDFKSKNCIIMEDQTIVLHNSFKHFQFTVLD